MELRNELLPFGFQRDFYTISWAGIAQLGIATRYGLHGPGIESGGGEIFRTCPDLAWGPPSLLYNGYRVFPGGKAAVAWR
jgi:hypothetical protein